MNDQRKVIFSQRIKILETKNISEMIRTFISEINDNMSKTLDNYEKSNDVKIFSNEIKSVLY